MHVSEIKGDIIDEEGVDLIGSRLSTDGTNSLLMKSPVWTGIFEWDFGTGSSTTFAMAQVLVGGLKSTSAFVPGSYRAEIFDI